MVVVGLSTVGGDNWTWYLMQLREAADGCNLQGIGLSFPWRAWKCHGVGNRGTVFELAYMDHDCNFSGLK